MHEVRRYLWEGHSLLAEAGYGSRDGTTTNLAPRWRYTYVPGASGLDDAVQVQVEDFVNPERSGLYAFMRDELGSVLGVVEERATAEGDPVPLVVRYLYTPYGEAHAESGPELRGLFFDNDLTVVESADGSVTQSIAGDRAPGALVLTFSVPVTDASLANGLQLVELGSSTTLVQGTDYAIGRDPDQPEVLQILTQTGWSRFDSGMVGAVTGAYELTLSGDLADAADRSLVHAGSYSWQVPEEEAVTAGVSDLEFVYDSITSASAHLDGRFPGGQNLLFQGLWTDPVTGLSYARNRWYDARNASWLSEDPKGAVDSTNLYAFVGWGPHVGRDPMGLATDLNYSYGGPKSPEVLSARREKAEEEFNAWCAENPGECQTYLTREEGLKKTVSGVGQGAAGVGALAAPDPTLTSKVFGWTAFVRGIDNVVAGVKQMITGEQTETALNQVVEFAAQEAGSSSEEAELIASHVETTVDVSSTLVASGATGYSYARQAMRGQSRVLRAVTPEEAESIRAGQGISRPQPHAKTTPTQHVGGTPHTRNPWISTTRSDESARFFASHGNTRSPNPIVEINLNKIDPTKVLDVSTPELAASHLQIPFAQNAAAAHQEVLVFGEIPPEAIVGFIK
ncbi:MAG: RHS repeat-associated core domain-containing protein [bacterium]|nr:RHS repeat-associated core domain-containing protein [bacterium]